MAAKKSDQSKFRFFIVDERNEPRSSCWVAHESAGSIYVSPRVTGGAMKLSFHRPGRSNDGCDSQYGFTNPYVRKENARTGQDLPMLARWTRSATPTDGYVQVASLVFPTDFLRGAIQHPPEPGKRKFAIPMAPPGAAIEVGLYYTRRATTDIESDFVGRGVTPLVWWELDDDEKVVLAAKQTPFNPELVPDFNNGNIQPLSGAPGGGESTDNLSAVLLFDAPTDRRPILLAEVNGLMVVNSSGTLGTSGTLI